MLTPVQAKLLLFASPALALLAMAACSGGDNSNPSGTSTLSAQTTSRTPAPSPTPGATAAPIAAVTRTATVQEGAAAALAAALQITGGVTGADCAAMPQTLCVTPPNSYATSIPQGIVEFAVNDPAHGGTGYVLVLGRNEAGAWQLFLGTQYAARPFTLPGSMLVCTGGQGLNVRATPASSASLIQTLADGTVLNGDQFVLTEPGTLGSAAATEGHGWYHINSPVDGWVYSDFVLPSNGQAQPCPS
jgi:hypothetical protein